MRFSQGNVSCPIYPCDPGKLGEFNRGVFYKKIWELLMSFILLMYTAGRVIIYHIEARPPGSHSMGSITVILKSDFNKNQINLILTGHIVLILVYCFR